MKTERQQDQDVAERLRRENLERVEAGGCAPPVLASAGPKDNEVDEKVEDFFERLYGMTFRLFLDPNSEEGEGNTVELRLGATVDNLALFETQDHAVLHTAATVAELRAEVGRLALAWRSERDASQEYARDCLVANKMLVAAESRAGELEAALKPLADACYAEFCSAATELKEPNISKVSYPEETCNITFGMIRNARKALTGADPT